MLVPHQRGQLVFKLLERLLDVWVKADRLLEYVVQMHPAARHDDVIRHGVHPIHRPVQEVGETPVSHAVQIEHHRIHLRLRVAYVPLPPICQTAHIRPIAFFEALKLLLEFVLEHDHLPASLAVSNDGYRIGLEQTGLLIALLYPMLPKLEYVGIHLDGGDFREARARQNLVFHGYLLGI